MVSLELDRRRCWMANAGSSLKEKKRKVKGKWRPKGSKTRNKR